MVAGVELLAMCGWDHQSWPSDKPLPAHSVLAQMAGNAWNAFAFGAVHTAWLACVCAPEEDVPEVKAPPAAETGKEEQEEQEDPSDDATESSTPAPSSPSSC